MKESWLPIKNYERLYEISNMGRIKALSKIGGCNQFRQERILSPSSCGKNVHITLYNNGNNQNVLIHRLVAEHFIGIIPKGYVINHIDNNPFNNMATNLEIVTQSQNVLHCVRQGRNNPNPQRGSESVNAKGIEVKTVNGDYVGCWGSISEAKKALNIKSNDIASVIKGNRAQLGGYTFKYANQ